jgi:signal transduction histidine kinase
MPAPLNERILEAFEAEQARRANAGTRAACLLGIGAFVAFFAIDPLLVEDVRPLWIVRVIFITIIASVMALTYRWTEGRSGVPLAVAACTAISLGVVLLTALTGGGESTYHEALILTFFGFALLVPMPPKIAGATFAGQVGLYCAALFITDQTGGVGLFVSNSGILAVGAAISTVGVVWSRNLRMQQFEGAFRLAQANEELQTLDRAKSRFFANLSHELRTPLTLALAPVEAMLDDSEETLSGPQRDYLELVRVNALRLLRLVDDLLELSRLEAATVRLQVQPVDLGPWLRGLVDQVSPLAGRKRIYMTFEASHDLPATLLDPHQIERVALNVLANAVKFTPEGGQIAVRVLLDGDGIVVEVEDSGIGIPKAQLPRIFERFHQVDGSSTRSHGGAGIGLSLARDLVELHGGRISADSAEGEGTTLRFWLPIAGPPEKVIDRRKRADRVDADRRDDAAGLSPWHQEMQERAAYRLQGIEDASERRVLPRHPADDVRTTVLLVEDNKDLVRFLASLLGTDYRVLHAPNGKIGLRLAQKERPELIVSDVMMPVMDGLEMVRRLRDAPETAGIPVLMLTARGSEVDRVEGREGGADTYLTKPFKPAELRAAVRGLIAKQQARREGARTAQERVLATLARGVAHEVLNPLTFLQNALFILKETAEDLLVSAPDPDIDALVQDAYAAGRSGIDRIREAVDDLKGLGGDGETEAPQLVALSQLAERVLKLVGPHRAGAKVEGELSSTGQVRVQRGQVERAIVHLVLNAQQASGDSGRVRILTWDTDEGVALAVEDDGPGVPFEKSSDIFDAYFTTRADGTGLGLALARAAVVAQGGTLELDRSPVGGARFVIRLPTE